VIDARVVSGWYIRPDGSIGAQEATWQWHLTVTAVPAPVLSQDDPVVRPTPAITPVPAPVPTEPSPAPEQVWTPETPVVVWEPEDETVGFPATAALVATTTIAAESPLAVPVTAASEDPVAPAVAAPAAPESAPATVPLPAIVLEVEDRPSGLSNILPIPPASAVLARAVPSRLAAVPAFREP
jgi:hypothetical protein